MGVKILELNCYVDPITIYFDGVSDFSDALTRWATGFVNLLTSRFNSIGRSSYKNNYKRIESFINTIIGFIPDEMHIPNTSLMIQGGISSDPQIIDSEFIIIPLDLSLHDTNHPMSYENTVDFPDIQHIPI